MDTGLTVLEVKGEFLGFFWYFCSAAGISSLYLCTVAGVSLDV